MRILITGATGFVGQNLMPMLTDKFPDAEMLLLCRNQEKARPLFPYGKVSVVDAEDWERVKAFNPDVVLHLASLSTSRNDSGIIKPLLDSNILYGVRLLDALRECGNLKLFVNTGSFAEYRWGAETLNDAYLYTATKSAFRVFVDYYSQLTGYKYINVVPYTIYGGKPTVKRLMDYILESMDSKEPVDMTAGEQILDFTHVDDLCDFYVHVVSNLNEMTQVGNGGDFHVGTGKGTSIRELAAIMEDVYGRKCNIRWGGRPYRDRDTMYAVAPIAKNMELLHWRANIMLRDGIVKMSSHGCSIYGFKTV